jgi:hypothetical protein
MSFPPGTEMFQFPGFASRPYGFGPGSPRREGFPHSDIRGSTIARISPRLFAACHVLHRLLAPRHPPDALFTLGSQTATARTQDRAAPHDEHAPSRMRGRGSRTIRARSHFHSQNYTTNPDSPVKEQKPRRRMTPARPAFWKRSQTSARPKPRAPSGGIPMRADIKHPPHAPCGMCGTSRMSGHREWRTEPVEDSVIVRTGRNRNASRRSASRPYP